MVDHVLREKAKTKVWRESAEVLESEKNELLEVVERLRISIEILVTTHCLHLCTQCVVGLRQDNCLLLKSFRCRLPWG
jgi:hypothetical protein